MPKINYMSLNSGIYFKKTRVTKEDRKEFLDSYTAEYRKQLFNALARYMISVGDVPKRNTFTEYYKFFSKALGVKIKKEDRFKWLCQVARAIERNQHKQFNIKELQIRIPKG